MSSTMFSALNLNLRMTQIGIWCSGTRKCSQRCEINHFCQGFVSAIQSSEMHPEIPSELHLEIPLEISSEIHLEILVEISPELHLEMHFEIYPNNEIYGRSMGYVQHIAKNTKTCQDARTNSKTKPQFHHPRKTPPPTSLSVLDEISPELQLEMHFEISRNNEIYGRSIWGMCNTSLRTQRHARTRKETARRNRNSIIHAKPHPQPPYQVLAWSYRYAQGKWYARVVCATSWCLFARLGVPFSSERCAAHNHMLRA